MNGIPMDRIVPPYQAREVTEDEHKVFAAMAPDADRKGDDDAITWLLAVRKFGLGEANRMFPEG